MTDYDSCPTCGDTAAVHVRDEDDDTVYECRSCRTPLMESWLNTENWTLAEDYADV